MVDSVLEGSTLEDREDLGSGDAATYEYWMGQEAIAEREERKWIKKGREIVKRYRDDRPETGESHRYNILWSNVQTLKPALYARTPKPDVERRYKDQDDVGRLASIILERALSYAVDSPADDFDDTMSACVEDKLLPGRGICRILYVPKYGEPISADEDNAAFEQEQDAPAIVDSAGDEEGPDQGQNSNPITPQIEPLREVVYEEAILKYVFWEDYREGPARQWNEVPWIRYRATMNRDELVTRFGKKGKQVNLDYTPKGSPEDSKTNDGPQDIFKKAFVYEYWDKPTKRVIWIAPGTPDLVLDEQDDPLGLLNFFPNVKPLAATMTNDKRIPVADYIEYQDQARELDTLTNRIDRLLRALKVSGIYPGDEKQVLQQLVDAGTDNLLIPVNDWAKWQDGGGLKEFIQWMPIQQVAETLTQLYAARDKIKNDLYEITGIGDIMRGDTQSDETATAQKLKTNFITRRVVPQQRDVAKFARNNFRLIANVIAEHFSPKTISLMTGYPQLQPVPQAPPPPPQFLPPPNPMQQSPMQGAPMQAPQQPQGAQVVPMGGVPGMPPGPPQPPQPQPNPAYAQWQQIMQKAQAVQAQNQQLQQQFDAAVALIKKDGIYGFRIDIEADSTIAPDEAEEQQKRTEFLSEFVPFMQQLVPIAQGNPKMAELAKQFALFAVRGFRVARPLEESVEAAFDELAQMPPHPSQQGKPASGSQVDSPADLALRGKEIDAKTQVAQQANTIKLQQVQGTLANDAAELSLKEQEAKGRLALDGAKAVSDDRFRTTRADAMEARSAKGLT